MGSLSELAPPPILDQVLGRQRVGESSAMPQMSPIAAAKVLGEGSQMPQASPLGGGSAMPKPSPIAAPRADEELPTRMRDAPLRGVHYVMMVVGALVPLVVWGLVAWVAIHGPIGHKAGAPKGATEQPKH
jgi:hypothetical protein